MQILQILTPTNTTAMGQIQIQICIQIQMQILTPAPLQWDNNAEQLSNALINLKVGGGRGWNNFRTLKG